jgi:alcohol dehydrogenase/L-iditol 2-dehydrogenase
MQVARLRGAASIVALGAASDGLRLDKARRLAADRTVDITAEDPVSIVAGMGDGLGADLVVDATGVSAALEQSLDLVRPGGMIAKIGWGPQPLNYSLDPLVAKSVTLHGSFSHTWDTWERVLRLFAKDRLDPASVIGNTYGLEDFAEAFSAMEDGRNIKSVILMPEHQQYAPVPR